MRRGVQGIPRPCRLHDLHCRIISLRCFSRRHRQTWVQTLHQTHSSRRRPRYRALEVSLTSATPELKSYLIPPSSFPYLVSINSVLPALIAGNAVLFKPSPQTPLTAERFALALTRAGVPEALIQVVHMSPELTSFAVKHPAVDFVSFTGSVVGGRAVEEAAVSAQGFKGVALEVRVSF